MMNSMTSDRWYTGRVLANDPGSDETLKTQIFPEIKVVHLQENTQIFPETKVVNL